MIDRLLYRDILRGLSAFPVVVLLGPRQVGKTTLAKELSSGGKRPVHYLDLERPSSMAALKIIS